MCVSVKLLGFIRIFLSQSPGKPPIARHRMNPDRDGRQVTGFSVEKDVVGRKESLGCKNTGSPIERSLVFLLENPGIDPGASRMLSERSTS